MVILSNLNSQKRSNDYSGILGKRVYQITVNCNIHLGFKMKKKSTKDLTYVQAISLNVVSGVSRVQGGRLGLLWIKDSNLVGSPFIYATVRGAQVRTSAV